jgi:hypothetical protein
MEKLTRFRAGDGSDEEVSVWIEKIRHSVPHPEVLNVIARNNKAKSSDQIVDQLMSYIPITLNSDTEK